jgi:hypothetical protein
MANFTTAAAAMQVEETTRRVSLHTGLVKFDGRFANRVQNPIEVPEFLHKLYLKLQRADPTFQMGDKHGKVMPMDAIPDSYNGCMEHFNLQVLPKKDHQHLMFVVTFHSTKPLGVLKRSAMDLLKRNHLFMNRHALDAATLDVATIGWLLGAHPRYHSPTLQQTMMEEMMEVWWATSSKAIKQQWGQRFDAADKDDNLKIPEFFINARAITARDGTGQTVQESAFLVVAPAKSTKL